MHRSKLKRISLAICFALLPLAANAAGLGKLTVISGLGEPLRAEIELLSTTPEELASLTAIIAPEEAYAVQGVERTALQGTIKIEVSKKANGDPILKLSTNQAVSDPFLDMLIQVDWATGRLLREYTILLDPPGYKDESTAPSSNNGVPSASDSTKDSTSAITPAAPKVKKSRSTGAGSGRKSGKSAAPAAAEENAVPQETDNINPEGHTTVRGDTLSTIAAQMQVQGVSLEQMLVGLYHANQQAFTGGNMNRLKVGQIMHAPSPEELQSISRKDAAVEIRAQAADWNAYRSKLAGTVAAAPASSENTGNQAASGKISAPAEDKAAPDATSSRDVVKLSKNDAATNNNDASGNAKAMQDKLNALQEEVTARENSVKEANDRTAALEKQIADMQKLLAVKSQTMADMQKSAAAQAPAAKSEPAEAPKAEAAKPAEPVKPVEAAQPVAAQPVATNMPAATPVAETGIVDQPKKKKKIIIPPPAPVEEGLLDGLLKEPLLPAAGAGTLALLAGAWLFLRNRRKHGLDSFEQGILTSGKLKANTVFGNTAGETVDTGDTSFLTDFSQSSGAGMIDTHDVDPIAEAEVYMAYGRDAQAEEILKDAIEKEPKRYELHLKLLEIFAGRNDTSAFETIAGELYSTLGSADPTWIKIAEMGRKLESDNPLYDTASSPASVAIPAAAQNLGASDFANAEVMSEANLDFSLDNDTASEPHVEEVAEQTEDASSSLDFDLGMADETPAPETLPEINMPDDPASAMSMEVPTEINDLEFQLNKPAANVDQASASITDASGMEEDTIQLHVSDFGHTLPNFELPELEAEKPAPVEGAAELALPEISFDLPEVANEELATPPIPETATAPELPDFDKTMIMQPTAAEEEIVFEAAAGKPDDLDLNFDLETAQTENKNAAEPDMENEAANAPHIDLSGISLNFGPTTDLVVEQIDMTSAEPAEVETKLDLVAAYIDMGDSEGARELLDEVLKEGGTAQRERAQQMLNTLA